MGVRGKIEAVLYAADEPVTLAQLASLFGAEALAEQAESTQALTEEPPSGILSAEAAPGIEASTGGIPEEAMDGRVDVPVPDEPEPAATIEPDATEPASAEPGEADSTPGVIENDPRLQRQQERARREAVRSVLDALIAAYNSDERGMEIREIAGGYRVATKPEYHDAVRSFAKSLKPPMKLSLQALETLAVIAYKQPVTAPEVSEIRGVDSGGVLGSLMSRKLVTTAGRKQVLGRPILYKTTREFLLRFGLKDINELPSMEEFEKMAGELRALGEDADPAPADAATAAELPSPEDPVAGLEAPSEPELSIIVEDEQPAEDAGMQVEPGGAAVADDAVPQQMEEEHG